MRSAPRTVVITGAAAGVGRATAHRFARAGARIGLIARDAAALAEVRSEIAQLGGQAFAAPADVADPAAVREAADRIVAALGPIDVWVNNAMVTVFSPFTEMSPAEFKRVTAVTYLGTVHGTQAALRAMRPRNRGVIIQVGSALSYRGIPLQTAYCGAKYAIRGFTDALRCELIHDRSGIALTMIQLPAVNTPQFDWARVHLPYQPRPVPPVVQPELIADAIYRASLRPRREYWVGKSTLEAILANMVMPAFLDRMLARKAYAGQMTGVPALRSREDNLDAPVPALHRTGGSFGREAARRGWVISGSHARAGAAVLAATLAFLAGVAVERMLAAPEPRDR
jgi:NAD(P)-dependent dehydrogenase (short-subunit alcohol dehydrogenase family)